MNLDAPAAAAGDSDPRTGLLALVSADFAVPIQPSSSSGAEATHGQALQEVR